MSKSRDLADLISSGSLLADGVLSSTEIDGVTATAAELNILDGVTATTAELNYVDGVTSAIQTQLDGKQTSDAQLTDIAGLTPTDGNIIVGDGTNFVTESSATARTSLGVAIGTDVQAYDSNLTSFVGTFTLPTTDGTADQVLKTNGSGTLSFADAGGGGAWELLTTVTWSSTVDYVDLTSGFSSTYDTYIIEWTDVEHSNDYGTMNGYLRRGSTWYTSGVYYYTEISGTSVQEMSTQGGMDLGYSGKTGYYYGKANGFIQLRGVNNTDTEGPTYFSMSPNWSKGWITMGGLYSGTEAVTGFRLDGSQSFASGQMRMYGLKKS